MERSWRWVLGMLYVVAVAVIWITASFVVQSVVDAGVSPFLLSYICNSLFVVYLPIVEAGRWLLARGPQKSTEELEGPLVGGASSSGNARNREWSRREIAQVSLLICPFWFLAQFTFNLSLRYTSVTSNTILSSASSLFTFLFSLALLNERFKWTKLLSVLLCMAGTIIVTLADSTDSEGSHKRAGWGDILCLVSALVYALYSTLLRKRLPDEEAGEGRASTALFFGYLGLFNALLLGPVGVVLHLSGLETFRRLTLSQLGLIVGKGLLDNVLSDYLWAKAVLLTTPTAATTGLTIQVPIAGVVDSLRGRVPSPLNILGAAAILLGFFGINEPATGCFGSSTEEEVDDFDNVKEGRVDGGTV